VRFSGDDYRLSYPKNSGAFLVTFYSCLSPLSARQASYHRQGHCDALENWTGRLEYEIRQEQAATIGRLARELRDALDALDAFNRRASGGKTAADSRDLQRTRLVDAAAYALWNFVVQRECSGFRETEQVLKEYAVPVEVRVKMGAVRSPVHG